MRNCSVSCIVMDLVFAGLLWADPSVATITHREFQAVNANGEQTYAAPQKVTLEGIVLHNPADMLNPTPDDSITQLYNMGGQWQLFFQGQGVDHAGTAVWMGQLYNNLPWISPTGGYSNAEFIAELTRINGAQFAPGDLVRVTGYYLSYAGKNNINEQHNKNPDHNFMIELVKRGVGLPRLDAITLDDLKDAQDRFIFDPLRLRGGEYYQGCLVKIKDVNVVDANTWGPNGQLMLTNGHKTLPVLLGRGTGIYAGSFNLTQPFDAIGILDQESTDLKSGYYLYVMNYDGNGRVLASYEHRMADTGAGEN